LLHQNFSSRSFQLKAERERQEKRDANEERVNGTVRSAKVSNAKVEKNRRRPFFDLVLENTFLIRRSESNDFDLIVEKNNILF
jgi:hypothetical protein